jgi:predicted Na+-dependent transporter
MSEFWIFVAIPFAVGLITGVIVPRWTSQKRLALIITPCASAFVICLIVFVWDWHYRATHPTDRNQALPAVLRSLIGTLAYSPGIFLFGAIPSVAGTALIELCKAGLRKRSPHAHRP